MSGVLHRYRYRTEALAGPWRESAERALGDAVKARQARADGRAFEWLVRGWIETQARPPVGMGAFA